MVWLISLCVLIIFLLFSRINVSINYSFLDSKQSGTIHIFFLKIPLYRKNIQSNENKQYSILEMLDGIPDQLHEVKFFLKTIKDTIPSVYWTLNRLKITQMDWHTNVGAGEASSTGMVTGSIWSLKGLLIAFLRETSYVACSLHVNVNPYFQHQILSSQIKMKFSIRLGQAILGGLKIMRSFSKRKEIAIKLHERKI